MLRETRPQHVRVRALVTGAGALPAGIHCR
uniref:Uncharacterized protein n=1 Tax=Siphoviridae sp. ctJyX12 TaxID=2827840 RepID=A0A8S5SQV0_9CAUD|nr:MAG TPA: hypothetical protein [Siphoviridae sp. ctJyX12]